MATLHMDVEQVESAQRNMMTQHGQLKAALDSITSQINSMIPANWQGNSAQEFQSVYDNLQRNINNQLAELEQLATRLNSEIAEWTAAGSRLN